MGYNVYLALVYVILLKNDIVYLIARYETYM